MKSKKILVPYDGSEPSERALEEAIGLARDFSAKTEIVLLNVVQEIPVPPLMFQFRARSKITGDEITTTELVKEVCQELKQAATVMLEKRKSAIRDLDVRTKTLVGQPVDKIVEFAAQERVDIIALGGVGLSGLSRFKALGSVSRGVAERAKCPVLIVH